jgi:hypothetical protein
MSQEEADQVVGHDNDHIPLSAWEETAHHLEGFAFSHPLSFAMFLEHSSCRAGRISFLPPYGSTRSTSMVAHSAQHRPF